MSKELLLEHLRKNSGKKEDETWFELAKKFGIEINSRYAKDTKEYKDSLSDTIRNLWKREGLKDQPDGPYKGMQLKSAWQIQRKGGEITTLHSYKVDENELEKNSREELLESFRKIANEITPVTSSLETNSGDCDKMLFMPISDMHIGAIGGNFISDNTYNKDVIMYRINKLIERIISEVNFHNVGRIVISDLGDTLDGYNGKTTRGGHDLEQNLNSREQFDTYVYAMKYLFDCIYNNCILSGKCKSISYFSMNNSNHDGPMAYMAQKAVEIYLNQKYPQINTFVCEKFFMYMSFGKHVFITTHGKDEKYLKQGLPLILDYKTEILIQRYLDSKNINSPYISVIKGDLHNLSEQNTYKIRYKNLPSFFGGSEWIHTNFGPTRAGVSYEIVDANNRDIIKREIWFNE